MLYRWVYSVLGGTLTGGILFTLFLLFPVDVSMSKKIPYIFVISFTSSWATALLAGKSWEGSNRDDI